MSIEDNKCVVTAFFTHLAAQDADALLALMSEDATWWIPTDQIGGLKQSKAQMAAVLPAMFAVYDRLPTIDVGRMIAAGDCVCAEQTARGGKTKGGQTYENDYLMLFVIRNGLINEIREFLNPIFVGPLAAEVMGQNHQ